MLKIIGIISLSFILCGCELSLDSKKERDEAIQECKESGGTPYVENYDDNHFRPIVHCKFEKID